MHFLDPAHTQLNALILRVDSSDVQIKFIPNGVYLVSELCPKLIGFVLEVIKRVGLSLHFLNHKLKLLEPPLHNMKFPILN